MSIKTNLTRLGQKGLAIVSKRSSTILTGMAVGGVVTTVIFTVRATVKAQDCLADAYAKKNEQVFKINRDNPTPMAEPEDLTNLEKVEACWKVFIPVAISAGTTIACAMAANVIDLKRQAAIMSAATIAETSLREYKSKTAEVLGEQKANKIEDELNQEKVSTTLETLSDGGILRAKGGNTLCYDAISGRPFYSDIETLRAAANEINRRLICGEYGQSLNDFYYEINLDPIKLGEEIGWSVETMCETYFTSGLRSDGTPYLVLDFKQAPFLCFRD